MRRGIAAFVGGVGLLAGLASCGGASAKEPWMIPVRSLSAPPPDQRCDAPTEKRFMVILEARADEGSTTDGRLAFVVSTQTVTCRRVSPGDPNGLASPRWSPRTPAKVEATFYTPEGQLKHAASFADWELSFVETAAPERNAQLQLWQSGDDVVTCRWQRGQPTFGGAKVSWPDGGGSYDGKCTLSPWP